MWLKSVKRAFPCIKAHLGKREEGRNDKGERERDKEGSKFWWHRGL